jgi:hypothetical protein
MIEKIKLQLICIIENIVLHVGIHRTDMCRGCGILEIRYCKIIIRCNKDKIRSDNLR